MSSFLGSAFFGFLITALGGSVRVPLQPAVTNAPATKTDDTLRIIFHRSAKRFASWPILSKCDYRTSN